MPARTRLTGAGTDRARRAGARRLAATIASASRARRGARCRPSRGRAAARARLTPSAGLRARARAGCSGGRRPGRSLPSQRPRRMRSRSSAGSSPAQRTRRRAHEDLEAEQGRDRVPGQAEDRRRAAHPNQIGLPGFTATLCRIGSTPRRSSACARRGRTCRPRRRRSSRAGRSRRAPSEGELEQHRGRRARRRSARPRSPAPRRPPRGRRCCPRGSARGPGFARRHELVAGGQDRDARRAKTGTGSPPIEASTERSDGREPPARLVRRSRPCAGSRRGG